MEICHPWHAHPLFLSDGTKYEEGKCSICEQGFDGNPFYACVDCKYYVHKSCAQLPVQIQHHFHPPHPLVLCFGFHFFCDSCHKRFRNELRFRCKMCNFDLDVKCALMTDIDTEGKEFITHFTHQHSLTICSKDGDNPLNCFACKKTSSDLIYGCTPCDYFLHKSCSEISTHVVHAKHPQHALSLVVKLDSCDYCEKYDHNWKYYCSICAFHLDVSCLLESAKDAQNSERSCFLCCKQHLNSDSCIDSYLINQSCIQLPETIKHDFHSHKPLLLLGSNDFECDSCHKWFDRRSHYGCEECNFRMDVKCALMTSYQYEESDESIWRVIPRHFKHQHPLQLISEVDDINCSACHTAKLSPIYGCIKCEYFLHQSCLELPFQIQHPLHDSHVLTIQPLLDNFCEICCRKYAGFAFGCIQCLFFIGIECILELGPTVVHKYHRHLLWFIEKSYWDRCNADDTFCQNTFCQFYSESSEFKLTKSYSLRCIECDYNLHFLCGPLPSTIKHKCHLHALKLVDYIVEDHLDEHYCDICEEIRNPRLCVYYCEDCKFFAHVHCVISEIINVFKKNSKKVELRIVGVLRPEDSINPYHNDLTGEFLLDLLEHLNENDMFWLRFYFPYGKLFLREEDPWEKPEQDSSSEDDTMNNIEELSFYNDDIILNMEKRLESFKPYIHIEPDECALPVIEVEGYKITSNFATLFRILLIKYGDFGHHSRPPKRVKSILLYFLCRVLRSMSRTFVVDITEKQLFTWLYYIRGISRSGFDLNFVDPFLDSIKRSYFGLRAMKFEDEGTARFDCEIVKLEKKISELKSQIEEFSTKEEELKRDRQQHRVGKIAEESAAMREIFTEAKELKWCKPGESIFCEECNFRMEVKSVLMTSIQYEESDESICPVITRHFKHQHPLQLINEVDDINCSACHTTKIINLFKKNSEKVELKIVEDLRLEDTINSSHNNLTEELLLDLLKRLDANDIFILRRYFPVGKLFTREEDDWKWLLQNSSYEDIDTSILEEFSFYNDVIIGNINERLRRRFKPYIKYHIQPDELELPVIEVEGYKVTSNFATLFISLLMKYGDFGHNFELSENVKFIVLYFLCRVLSSMRRTYVVDITEKQLFTWLYYIKGISDCGFDLEFVKPFLDRIMVSYLKFEDEATSRFDCEIEKAEKKISVLKTQVEDLKRDREQHKVANIAEGLAVMRKFLTEGKALKWCLAGMDMHGYCLN